MKLIENFPATFTPTTQQVELLNSIESAYNEGYKYVICCAPTGSGKSFLSKTISNSSQEPDAKYVSDVNDYSIYEQNQFGDFTNTEAYAPFGAFALTITKSLQDQYKSIFDDSGILKGKSNYICDVDNSVNADMAPCLYLKQLKGNCQNENKCAYYNARNKTLVNKFGVLNYSMFLSLPAHVKYREYMICDEASELEDELVSKYSRNLNYKLLKKMGHSITSIPINNYLKFHTWLCGFVAELNQEVDDLLKMFKKSKNVAVADKQKYSTYNQLCLSLQTTLDTWNQCEYLIEKEKEGLTLKPLRVSDIASNIFKYADKILLMSATIIDHKAFAKTLGITDYKYIEVDSTFNPANSPIYISNKVRINYKNLKEVLPYLTEQINKICQVHKMHKGVIHTHTMQITDYLKNNLKSDRYIFREPGVSNDKILAQHFESAENTVLVSPSLTFGVDLKDDLARFQIIVKASYLPLGDERIKRLFKEDPNWYQNKMLNNLIQACGRGSRHTGDKCVTYILDGNILDAVMRNKHKLPKYFLSRFN